MLPATTAYCTATTTTAVGDSNDAPPPGSHVSAPYMVWLPRTSKNAEEELIEARAAAVAVRATARDARMFDGISQHGRAM